jgi:hypothetical protein
MTGYSSYLSSLEVQRYKVYTGNAVMISILFLSVIDQHVLIPSVALAQLLTV